MAWSLDWERNIMEVPLYLSNWSDNNLLSVFITIDFVAFFSPYVRFEDFIDFFKWNWKEQNDTALIISLWFKKFCSFICRTKCANIEKNDLVPAKVGWPVTAYICIWYPNMGEL